ncbi:synaptonemal complex protein 3-like [Ornithorhynchus anatinus]|uniref:synaptonemal complex protein 3-like n=1 Tax=Ornithorhynchus anatinus TaxID=9258 RepID=UPI0010A8C7F7|nr:synaptonemal complex protein 3-like [Ornithorhynchus anatinus]
MTPRRGILNPLPSPLNPLRFSGQRLTVGGRWPRRFGRENGGNRWSRASPRRAPRLVARLASSRASPRRAPRLVTRLGPVLYQPLTATDLPTGSPLTLAFPPFYLPKPDVPRRPLLRPSAVRNSSIMTTNGENPSMKSDETIMKEQDAGAFQEEENEDLSGSQEDVERGQTSVADETETKNPGDIPSEMDEDYLGAEIQSLLDGFEGDTSKILPEVMKRLEQYIKSSLQVSTQNIGQHEQEKRDENKENSSQEFLNAFQYEDETVQIFEELYKSVTELLYQQSVSQQSGVNQDMLDAFKQKYDQFIKVW